jgi:hypothetical protein
MTAAIDSRRREISRLKREIAYYCGVIVRTISRERIGSAHAVIRLRERQLREAQSAATSRGGSDE